MTNPEHVFLVSGQVPEQKIGGQQGLSPVIVQRVVLAPDPAEAIRILATAEPSFRPLGHASLAHYEDTAQRLRAVANGQSSEWSVVSG